MEQSKNKLKLNVTTSVFNLLGTAYEPRKNITGILLAAEANGELYCNTAKQANDVLSTILGRDEHIMVNSYLRQNNDMKVIPFFVCEKKDSMEQIMASAAEKGYGICVIFARDEAGFYEAKDGKLKKQDFGVTRRIDKKAEEKITSLLTVFINEEKAKRAKNSAL